MDPARPAVPTRADQPLKQEGFGIADTETRSVTEDRRRSVLTGTMLGVAIMAAVDEIVFHQMLSWHHFYDRSTPSISLLSDGSLQTAYLVLMVAGFFWFADLRGRRTLARRSAWGGFVLGLGAFQLFDGIVDHKLLNLHQIRYGVDVLPYDLAWNGAALVLLLVGALMVWRSRDEGRTRADRR